MSAATITDGFTFKSMQAWDGAFIALHGVDCAISWVDYTRKGADIYEIWVNGSLVGHASKRPTEDNARDLLAPYFK